MARHSSPLSARRFSGGVVRGREKEGYGRPAEIHAIRSPRPGDAAAPIPAAGVPDHVPSPAPIGPANPAYGRAGVPHGQVEIGPPPSDLAQLDGRHDLGRPSALRQYWAPRGEEAPGTGLRIRAHGSD